MYLCLTAWPGSRSTAPSSPNCVCNCPSLSNFVAPLHRFPTTVDPFDRHRAQQASDSLAQIIRARRSRNSQKAASDGPLEDGRHRRLRCHEAIYEDRRMLNDVNVIENGGCLHHQKRMSDCKTIVAQALHLTSAMAADAAIAALSAASAASSSASSAACLVAEAESTASMLTLKHA